MQPKFDKDEYSYIGLFTLVHRVEEKCQYNRSDNTNKTSYSSSLQLKKMSMCIIIVIIPKMCLSQLLGVSFFYYID